MRKSTLRVQKKHFCRKSIFAIVSMRQPRFWSPGRRTVESEIDKKNDLETSPKQQLIFNILNPSNWHKQAPKSLQNRQKSCYLQPRVHPAAPMVLQSGLEVLPRCQNDTPRCSRGVKMGSQSVKKEAPSPPKAKRGWLQRAQPLRSMV